MSAKLKIVLVLAVSVVLAWSATKLTAQDDATAPASPTDTAQGTQEAKPPAVNLEDAFSFLPEVVAKAESFSIKAEDVQKAIKRQLSESQMPVAQLGSVPLPVRQNLAYSATQQLVDQRLIEKKARAEGYVPAKDLAQQQIEDWEKQVSKEELDKNLKENNTTREELKEDLARELGVRKWIQEEVLSNVTVDEEAARSFYKKNQEAFKTKEQTSASHILVSAEPSATEEEHKKARNEAEDMRKKLDEGADFSELAKESSDCPSSSQGGDLGFFGRGQMAPPFEEAAFGLEDGELSDVVKTRFGYHIIKGGPSKEAGTVPFEEAKPRIEQHLQQQEAQQALQSVIQVLRKQTEVTMLIEKPEMPQTAPQQPPPPAEADGE